MVMPRIGILNEPTVWWWHEQFLCCHRSASRYTIVNLILMFSKPLSLSLSWYERSLNMNSLAWKIAFDLMHWNRALINRTLIKNSGGLKIDTRKTTPLKIREKSSTEVFRSALAFPYNVWHVTDHKLHWEICFECT